MTTPDTPGPHVDPRDADRWATQPADLAAVSCSSCGRLRDPAHFLPDSHGPSWSPAERLCDECVPPRSGLGSVAP